MKLNSWLQRVAAGALCLIICAAGLGQVAFAANTSNRIQAMPSGYLGKGGEGEVCSLTLRYLYPGMNVRLYKIASVNERVQFTAEKKFEDVLAEMSNSKYRNLNEPKNQADWKDLAKQLNTAINSQGISVSDTTTTKLVGGEVVASFTGLEPGLYLAVNDRYDEKEKDKDGVEHEYVISSAPMLICLPNWMENETTKKYGWEPNVKVANVKLDRYLNDRFPLTVVKVWLDERGNPLTNHESSVVVELLQDGKLYTCDDGTSGRQTLNKNNGWSFIWYSLEPGHEYSVSEIMTDGTKNKYNVELVTVSGGGLNDKGLPVQAVNLKLSNRLKGEEPKDPDPKDSQPVSSQPVSSQPVSSQPVSSQPVSSQPVSSQPVSSQPVSSQPVSSQPVTTRPPTPTPTPPIEIDDPDVPLGELPGPNPDSPPEEIELDDPDVPLGNLPQTGQLWWPVPLMGVLGLFLVLIGIVQRRGDECDED